jgi:ferredoxin-NADP reductase
VTQAKVTAARPSCAVPTVSLQVNWARARVVDLLDETAHVRSIVLDPPDWPGHRAGQHVDVRITTDGGAHLERSYAIASSPADGHVMLTIERATGGRVSPYLAQELQVDDELDLRGPRGEDFVWEDAADAPLLLVGSGIGVVPLRAILRHWSAVHCDVPLRLLYSAERLADVIYRDELLRSSAYDEVDVRISLTAEQPPGWHGYARPVDRELLEAVAWPPDQRPLAYIAGPVAFVDQAARALLDLGHPADRIRAQRFGTR